MSILVTSSFFGVTWAFGVIDDKYIEPEPHNLLKDVAFGNIIDFGIGKNRIYALVTAQIGLSAFVGDILCQNGIQFRFCGIL